MKNFFLFALLFISSLIFAQEFPFPVSGELNQIELKIENISISDTKTVVTLSVVNQMESGAWYCADENIYLYSKESDKRYYITGKENIPTCPEKHEFKSVGEELRFKLIFPSIKYSGTRIDLIEDCNNSCFYFKDIILDNKLNSDIHLFDLALGQYQSGNKNLAAVNFERVIKEIPDNPTHVYGFAYSYLYKIAQESGNQKKADAWKSSFLNSSLPNKEYYLKNF
ncbi:MAG: hypothetical protein KAH10_07105 [Flavobacteriales bacterium]|nr:hypothetical protein [Flavobacteriales bacterium]